MPLLNADALIDLRNRQADAARSGQRCPKYVAQTWPNYCRECDEHFTDGHLRHLPRSDRSQAASEVLMPSSKVKYTHSTDTAISHINLGLESILCDGGTTDEEKVAIMYEIHGRMASMLLSLVEPAPERYPSFDREYQSGTKTLRKFRLLK